MATLTPEQIQLWGTGLADDLMVTSSAVQLLETLSWFLNSMPADLKTSDLEQLIEVAKENILKSQQKE
jgi:hypothetical protein